MALALSKSEEEIKEEDTPDIGAILKNVKATSLERFGFKGKKVLKGENWNARAPQLSKMGKNRFKYITPILNIRTTEDREQLINSKISLILNKVDLQVKNTKKIEIFDDRLHEFNCKECCLFKFDYIKNNFYVPDLNLPITKFKPLLRDWGTIIGREETLKPQLEPQIEAALIKFPKSRCVSPDLFASDEENFEQKDIEVQVASSSKMNDDENIMIPEAHQEEFDNNECIEISDSSEEPWAIPDQEHLNVTDYVKELLSKDRYSFDNNASTILKSADPNLNVMKDTNSSQESALNDEELNYSSNYASSLKARNGIQEPILNEREPNYLSPVKDKNDSQKSVSNEVEPNHSSSINGTRCSLESVFSDEELHYSTNYATPVKPRNDIQESILKEKEPNHLSPIGTPIGSQYIVKTNNVTPMLNYDVMTTPLILKELDKIGVKPLKRTRGAKLLKYIYDSTHPVTEIHDENPAKRARVEENEAIIEIVGEKLLENESLIFERRQKAKVKTCKTPLQIVWHNFLCTNPEIQEQILLYQPVQLETLHSMLKELGFMFHVQDLLTFLDRKCVTVRVAQSQSKMHR